VSVERARRADWRGLDRAGGREPELVEFPKVDLPKTAGRFDPLKSRYERSAWGTTVLLYGADRKNWQR
jgi:hypothetical protein